MVTAGQHAAARDLAVRNVFVVYPVLLSLVHLSKAHNLLPWDITEGLFEPVEPLPLALESALQIRPDSDNTSAIIVNNRPTEPDKKLTWELAIAKGGNLAKLLDSPELSQCGVEQSKFAEWKQLSESG